MRIAAFISTVVFTLWASTAFALAVLRLVRRIKAGQPDSTRSGNHRARLITTLREVLLHTRLNQITYVGVAHWFVFVAFGGLLLTLITAYGLILDPGFGLPVMGHTLGYTVATNVLAGAGLLSIVHLIAIRQAHNPKREGRRSRFFGSNMASAYFVEIVIVLIVVCVLILNALETSYRATPTDSLGIAISAIATFKIVVSMSWFLVIARRPTMGVAWHRFTAAFNIWFKRNPEGGVALGPLQPMRSHDKLIDFEDPADDAIFGVGQIEDMTWKGLLDLSSCTDCGRCQAVCPAYSTDKPLSPKLLITSMRDRAFSDSEQPLLGPDGVITDDILWSCTTCGACVEECPVDIEHVDLVVDMRRNQVLMESRFPSEISGLFKNIEAKGNPWGMNAGGRLAWISEVEFPVRVFGTGGEDHIPADVEWLFWVGCAGAYEDRAKRTTKAVAELLYTAGVEYMVLGDAENCTGDPARRAGNEFVYQMQAQQNIELLNGIGVKRIVVTCPHCLNSLGREYPQLDGHYEVIHHTELLSLLISENRLTIPESSNDKKITYHDPCYLGRHNRVFTPPRDLIAALGGDFVEMPRNSERSFCCGAGGGRMWMEENIGTRINNERANEAIATGAETIAVGCPFCNVMIGDAVNAQGSENQPVVEDVALMLLDRVKQI